MIIFVTDGVERDRIFELSGFVRPRQAAAIMDCLGRLIVHEGVDYDVEITFKKNEKGEDDDNVNMRIVPLTEKGKWWEKYAMEMIKKYPPTVENPPLSIPLENNEHNDEEVKSEPKEKEVENA